MLRKMLDCASINVSVLVLVCLVQHVTSSLVIDPSHDNKYSTDGAEVNRPKRQLEIKRNPMMLSAGQALRLQHFLEAQRAQEARQSEAREVSELEKLMDKSLHAVHENKRQLEIKRGELDASKEHAIERGLREEIERQLMDVADLEQQLSSALDTMQEKKRQLEIK